MTSGATIDNIRSRREACGVSREKLAREADISTSMVALFERGYQPGESDALVAVLAALERLEAAA